MLTIVVDKTLVSEILSEGKRQFKSSCPLLSRDEATQGEARGLVIFATDICNRHIYPSTPCHKALSTEAKVKQKRDFDQ